MQTGFIKNLADLMVNIKEYRNKQEKHWYSCGSSGHLGGDLKCPAEVRLVRSVSDKIILLASAKPNHKNLGLIKYEKNHMQIGIKLIYCFQNK